MSLRRRLYSRICFTDTQMVVFSTGSDRRAALAPMAGKFKPHFQSFIFPNDRECIIVGPSGSVRRRVSRCSQKDNTIFSF